MQPLPAAGHRLPIVVIGHVAGGEHALDAGVRALRRGPFDVAAFVEFQLPVKEVRRSACARSPEIARTTEPFRFRRCADL